MFGIVAIRFSPTHRIREPNMSVKAKPDGYHTATPYLVVDNAAAALDFYRKAFGAQESSRFEHDGKVLHAEIRIGDSPIMLGEAMPEMGYRSPKAIGGTPVSLMLYVADADKDFARAVAAGAEASSPVQDQFYGDRTGKIVDPFGHIWNIATHKEDVAPAEMQRRFQEMIAGMTAG
jgi:PhnB protein